MITSVQRAEEVLLRRFAREALNGESRAWAEQIERHNRRVVVSLLAMGLTLERAHDLTQEAWARLIHQQARGKLGRLELPGLAIALASYRNRAVNPPSTIKEWPVT